MFLRAPGFLLLSIVSSLGAFAACAADGVADPNDDTPTKTFTSAAEVAALYE